LSKDLPGYENDCVTPLEAEDCRTPLMCTEYPDHYEKQYRLDSLALHKHFWKLL